MSPTLFSGGQIFSGTGGMVAGHGVLVEEGRIREMAPVAAFAGFAGPRVDTTGATLMPGLIDCHVHLALGAEENVVGVLRDQSPGALTLTVLENAQATLAGGITTVRDLGGRDYMEFAVRDAIAAGRHLGPTLRCAGQVVCMTGGHGHWIGIEADGPDAVTQAVRENVKQGADCIKIMATGGVLTPGVDPLAAHFTAEEMAAGVRTAHGLGRRIAAHAQGAAGILNAVIAGIDSIEHGFELTDAIIARMVDQGTALVPTLSAAGILMRHQGPLPAHVRDKINRYGALHQESFRRYVKAGGKVAMGTDAGTPGNRHGENVQELAFMVELGMTARDALVAATATAADLLDLPDHGRIRAGAVADLLLVAGDPVADITAVTDRARHRGLWKGGVDVAVALGALPPRGGAPVFARAAGF
ncbi:MAG: hypothetical protein RLY86_1596 [Pseudomonadota bacterium]